MYLQRTVQSTVQSEGYRDVEHAAGERRQKRAPEHERGDRGARRALGEVHARGEGPRDVREAVHVERHERPRDERAGERVERSPQHAHLHRHLVHVPDTVRVHIIDLFSYTVQFI